MCEYPLYTLVRGAISRLHRVFRESLFSLLSFTRGLLERGFFARNREAFFVEIVSSDVISIVFVGVVKEMDR